jgi:uncharacterized spore protein YtfJ
MEQLKNLLEKVTGQLDALTKGNKVVAKTISVGSRHVISLCELSMGFGVGGGTASDQENKSKGTGGGSGAGIKIGPVAVIVVDDGKVRIESLEG